MDYSNKENLVLDSEEPKWLVFNSIALLAEIFFVYLTIHFWDLMGSVFFAFTKISFFFIVLFSALVSLCLLIPACIAIWMYLKLLIKFFFLLVEWSKQLPQKLKYELEILKLIWNNRGFGKYALFGGFTFYFKLRQRILAFFLFGLSVALLAYGFYFKFKDYHRTYWREKVFYGQSPLNIYTLLPNKTYTVKTELMLHLIKIENSKQMVYFPIDKERYLRHEVPIPQEWNITFGDTTKLTLAAAFFTSPSLSQLFETYDLEIWEDLKNGQKLDTGYIRKFTPSQVYEKNIPLTFPPQYWEN